MDKDQIKSQIQKVLKSLKLPVIDFQILDSPKKEFGDVSTNVAFLVMKEFSTHSVRSNNKKETQRSLGEVESAPSPKDVSSLAEQIAIKLFQTMQFEKVEVVNGYINIFLKNQDLNQLIDSVIKLGKNFGSIKSKKPKKIQIEFISANPTGPLTVGNSRGGVIGDVLANVFEKVGNNLTREYYFNDAGGQIDQLGHSVLKDKEAVYKGQYIEELNKKLKIKNKRLFENQDYKKIGELAAKEIIKTIKKTTKDMGISYDVWFAEGKDLRKTGKVEKIIKWLEDKNLAYKKDGAIWFKATKFGDDKDRVVVRSNGMPTYFGVDCAYHKNKFLERKFNKVINIWGADHHGDVARVKGFVKSIGREKDFEILLHQFVKLVKDGKEYRMSKRKGNYVLVEDLLKEVGRDAYRFFMLSYATNSHLVFDIDLAKQRNSDNPVYYVQYAYARIQSILSKYKKQNIKNKNIGYAIELKESAERELAKKILEFPELIKNISESYQVHQLTNYSIELARSFHYFYEKCPIIKASPEIQASRYQLLLATEIALKNVFDIMGITALKKM